ncbi:MAG: alpha/beta fold hydrolase [Ferruginibacter sp.]
MKKRIFKWIKILAVAYFGIGITFYLLQEKLLFHPVKLERSYHYRFDVPFKEIDIAINKTDTLNMVQFFPKDSLRKGVVLYFHGNMENINHYQKFAANFTSQGYEVWMEDYPGFGKSIGERSEKNMNLQAWQVYEMANAKYKSDSIIIYGKSLGTGVASYVASNANCKRLILETPYYSIPALFNSFAPVYPVDWASHYKFRINEYLPDVKSPISIFHGNNDWIIPYRCAAKLKQFLKPADEFITIDGGSHNNLNDYPLFHQKLDSLLK